MQTQVRVTCYTATGISKRIVLKTITCRNQAGQRMPEYSELCARAAKKQFACARCVASGNPLHLPDVMAEPFVNALTFQVVTMIITTHLHQHVCANT